MRHLIAALLLLVAGTMPAAAVTITFEAFNIGDGPVSSADWIASNGYEFTGGSFPGPIPNGNLAKIFIGNSGSKSFGASSTFPGQDGFGAVASVSMRKADGGAFAISSLDLLMQAQNIFGPSTGSTSIAGTLAGGGTANLAVAVGTGDWLNLQLVTFTATGDNSGFAGLTAVQIDNINVAAVPVPAAVWLFGSGLGLLGWIRPRCRHRNY